MRDEDGVVIVHFSATDPDEWMRNADPLPPTRCGVLGTWTSKEDAVTCKGCLRVAVEEAGK